MKINSFPKDFIWGTATASYQIEGARNEDGKGLSIWDTFTHTPGKIKNGDTGDVACDFYHMYKDDIRLMIELGYKALRLSFSWPRILPLGTGDVNRKGIEFYRNVLAELKKNGIAVAITLYHWDLPQALQDRGGWANRKTAEAFGDYADLCFGEFGDLVDYWITLNEPMVVSYLGYMTGYHAPGLSNIEFYLSSIHNLNLAHGLAVQKFRKRGLSSTIGITNNRSWNMPNDPTNSNDIYAARYVDEMFYNSFLDPIIFGQYPASYYRTVQKFNLEPIVSEEDLQLISQKIDFIGLNYYSRMLIKYDEKSKMGFTEIIGPLEKSEMGWEIFPEGLYYILIDLNKRYNNLPIYITENGISINDRISDGEVNDTKRIKYLEKHIQVCTRAIKEGVNLKGYFVWCFTDNFEWSEGYSQRFGLVFTDYKSQKRIPKASAYWYSQLIRDNS